MRTYFPQSYFLEIDTRVGFDSEFSREHDCLSNVRGLNDDFEVRQYSAPVASAEEFFKSYLAIFLCFFFKWRKFENVLSFGEVKLLAFSAFA